MTRYKAMFEILHFGEAEEIAHYKEGRFSEAYAIHHARNSLILFLNENPVKNIILQLEDMTSYGVDDNGYWVYNPHYFVQSEEVRNLLIKLKQKFI